VKEERPLDKGALQAMPRDVLAKLGRAVIAARYDEIVEFIEAVRMTKPKVPPSFGGWLTALTTMGCWPPGPVRG